MSLRRTIFVLIGVLLLSSCERAVIPESRFAEIYHDILLADSYVNGSDLIRQTDSIVVYQDIIEKHGWTLAQFNSAQQFYLAHPETFAKLLKNLQIQLKNEKKELELQMTPDTLEFKPPVGRDSLENVSDVIELQ